MAEEQDLQVVHEPDGSRYELFLDGERVGFAEYRLGDGRILFTYIEIDPARQGRGLAAVLTKAALDDSRERGLQIAARCPYIVDYLETHPEYLAPSGT